MLSRLGLHLRNYELRAQIRGKKDAKALLE
jgi:hypothetical protein